MSIPSRYNEELKSEIFHTLLERTENDIIVWEERISSYGTFYFPNQDGRNLSISLYVSDVRFIWKYELTICGHVWKSLRLRKLYKAIINQQTRYKNEELKTISQKLLDLSG